jgi:type 1 glutamine amidotransferase
MPRILLFSKTTGYRHHEAIDLGIALIQQAAAADGVEVVATEDNAAFEAPALAGFDAAVWLQVSGDVLTDPQREAFGAFLRAGGGFAGIHGASDAERSWPDYEDIVGARFLYHPKLQAQTADLWAEATHPCTAGLPEPWRWTEEWYTFERNPRGLVEVLLKVDEQTYDVQEQCMGADHPICWAGHFGAGRTWYTALGHHRESYADPVFARHIWGGITSVVA